MAKAFVSIYFFSLWQRNIQAKNEERAYIAKSKGKGRPMQCKIGVIYREHNISL